MCFREGAIGDHALAVTNADSAGIADGMQLRPAKKLAFGHEIFPKASIFSVDRLLFVLGQGIPCFLIVLDH